MRKTAHRGFAQDNPENTLLAIRNAQTHNIDEIEIDVRRCKTGELVVIHDENIDRVTNQTGRVSDLTLEELQATTVLDSDEPIPTLKQALQKVNDDIRLNIELKETGLAHDTLQLTKQTDFDVLICSFIPDAIQEVNEITDEVKTAYLEQTDARKALDTALELDCSAVNLNHEIADVQIVETIHEHGLDVNAWTIQSKDEFNSLPNNIDGVISDSIEHMENAD